METLLFILQTAVILILIWATKYLQTKALNKAHKEDIATITSIVEGIKNELQNQNELIKAKLSYKSQHTLQVKSEEREAYFDFNRKFFAWYYTIERFSFSHYGLDNFEGLNEIYDNLRIRRYESDVARAHLSLFTDPDFINLELDLLEAVMQIEYPLIKKISEVYYTYSICKIQLEHSGGDYQKEEISRNTMQNKILELTNYYYSNYTEQYKLIAPIKTRFKDEINKRLKQLENLES